MRWSRHQYKQHAFAARADAFRHALEQSLEEAHYLAASSRKPRYHLDATLQELDQPKFSIADNAI
ncbi:MAG: hypothetical protein WCF13_09525, partial [Stellaceae bacterium]